MITNLVEMRRHDTSWAINQNPTVIIIKRKGLIRANGKIIRGESELPPQTVRLYVKGGSENTVIETSGERTTDRYYGMLATHDADILSESEAKDYFYADGVKYEVKAVFPQKINGEVVGLQCQIERVV